MIFQLKAKQFHNWHKDSKYYLVKISTKYFLYVPFTDIALFHLNASSLCQCLEQVYRNVTHFSKIWGQSPAIEKEHLSATTITDGETEKHILWQITNV